VIKQANPATDSTSLHSQRWQVLGWLTVCALAGVLLLFLFKDSAQHDGGAHYLFARWAWRHPEMFLDVWGRPLFTLLYAFPALLNFQAARALTVVVCLATAWQTWQLAWQLKMPRAPLAIPFLFLQPSLFLFCADTMTEPMFALLFVIALRLHLRGRVTAGMFVASLFILTRPEGLFMSLLWAVWVLRAQFSSVQAVIRQLPAAILRLLPLGTGMFIWWLAAWLITGDVLFIKHNWPTNWPFSGTFYGAPGLLNYPARLPEIVGPLLLPAFLYGMYRLLKQRELGVLTSSFLTLFLIHTVMRAYGLMGSAGYPRYLITVAPATALITLAGWNWLAERFAHLARPLRVAFVALLMTISASANFLYDDGAEWTRDATLVEKTYAWWAAQPRPLTRVIWSQPYMCMLLESDPWQNESFTQDAAKNRQLMQALPPGTLVFWDAKSGPRWTDVKIEDFRANGFELLHEERAVLEGYVIWRSFFGVGGPRHQRMALLYKPPPAP
jgi:hypothetical protein